MGVVVRQRLQLRLQRRVHRGAAARQAAIEYNFRARTSSAMASRRRRRRRSRSSRRRVGTDVADLHARAAGHERVRAGGGVVYHTYSDLRARARRPVGHVPVAGPRAAGPQRAGIWWRRHDEYEQAHERCPRADGARSSASRRCCFAASAAVTIAWCASMSAMAGHADARRLDDVDGVDADAGTGVARRRGVVPRHVGRDDGGDDAAVARPDAAALPRRPWRRRAGAPRSADRAGRRRLLRRLDAARLVAFPLGVALAAVEMRQPALARAVPIAVGVVVLVAGAPPVHRLEGAPPRLLPGGAGRGRALPADAGTAWRHGLRLGVQCSRCCAGLMAILLVIGVMDLRAMAVVTAAITVERAGARRRARRPRGRRRRRRGRPGPDRRAAGQALAVPV